MQLRHETRLTSEQYVIERAWCEASLLACPEHPAGGCGFARHGTYPRVRPAGMQVTRYYCPLAHTSFSLLPDCLSARLGGSLDEVEQAVVRAESIGLAAAAQELRLLELDLPGALRWLRRRREGVRAALLALVTALSGLLPGSRPEVAALRAVLGTDRVLVALRGMGADYLQVLPCPLGFCPLPTRRIQRERSFQHKTGPDPPG